MDLWIFASTFGPTCQLKFRVQLDIGVCFNRVPLKKYKTIRIHDWRVCSDA